MVAPTSEAPTEFVDVVRGYSKKLAGLLSERPWAPWNPAMWRSTRSARADPELAKVLQRLYRLTDELLRMYCIGPDDAGGEHWGLSKEEQQRVLDVLATDPAELRLDSGLAVFDAFDRLLIEIGDARYICAEVQREMLMSERRHQSGGVAGPLRRGPTSCAGDVQLGRHTEARRARRRSQHARQPAPGVQR